MFAEAGAGSDRQGTRRRHTAVADGLGPEHDCRQLFLRRQGAELLAAETTSAMPACINDASLQRCRCHRGVTFPPDSVAIFVCLAAIVLCTAGPCFEHLRLKATGRLPLSAAAQDPPPGRATADMRAGGPGVRDARAKHLHPAPAALCARPLLGAQPAAAGADSCFAVLASKFQVEPVRLCICSSSPPGCCSLSMYFSTHTCPTRSADSPALWTTDRAVTPRTLFAHEGDRGQLDRGPI